MAFLKNGEEEEEEEEEENVKDNLLTCLLTPQAKTTNLRISEANIMVI